MEINKENNLITKNGRAIEGRFKIDKNNNLQYLIKKDSVWRKEIGLPSRMKLRGNWRLNKNHDLEFLLSKIHKKIDNDILTLRGDILDVREDKLTFLVHSRERHGREYLQTLNLSGAWQADRFNRIGFAVKRGSGKRDFLRFDGSWQVNRQHQIVYSYKKRYLQRKTRIARSITFKGFWQINKKHRLGFLLGKGVSGFNFRVFAQSTSLRQKKAAIKYRLGIGRKKTQSYKEKMLTLFGKIRFTRKGDIIFNIDYGKDIKVKAISFAAVYHLNRENDIVFELKNQEGEDLGLSFTLKRKLLKNYSKLLIRIEGKKKEVGLRLGLKIPW